MLTNTSAYKGALDSTVLLGFLFWWRTFRGAREEAEFVTFLYPASTTGVWAIELPSDLSNCCCNAAGLSVHSNTTSATVSYSGIPA